MENTNSDPLNADKNAGVPRTETGNIALSADFTPGPWQVCRAETEAEWDVMTADGYYVAQAFEMFGVGDRVETLANARLIAAAPALYAALKEIFNYGVEFDDQRLSYVVAHVDKDAIADAYDALELAKPGKEQK